MKYSHDVFVSYAHTDNAALLPEQPGWVSSLVETLRKVVAQKLPRDGSNQVRPTVWMDPRLPGNREFDGEIERALAGSATLLVIHSPAYRESRWCMRELETFLRLLSERGDRIDGRVFVVDYDEAERAPGLSLLPGYRFWRRDPGDRPARPLGFPVPDANEREYFDRVLDVAHDLAAQLATAPEHPAAAAPTGPTVFLAETTDDLEPQREEVRRYLQQAGLRVVPEMWYPRDDPQAFAAAVRRDLAGARLFVQLLGPLAGRRPPELPQGYAARQHELATDARVPVLQWRPRELAPTAGETAQQQALLGGPTVQAIGLEEFKRNVTEALRPAPPSRHTRVRPLNAPKFVFINHGPSDRDLAGAIRRVLSQRQLGTGVMIDRGTSAEIRDFLEVNLLNCDGLIMVYGDATPRWLASQIHEYRKVTPQRETSVRVWAVCDGPPEKAGELPFDFPGLGYIDCRRGVDAAALEEFIRRLNEEDDHDDGESGNAPGKAP